MIYTLPIEFDFPIQIKTPQFPPDSCRFSSKVNGYDDEGVRVTNLVGFENGDFLKICPNCNRIFSATHFGLRNMGNGDIRDQSNCPDCRSRY